MSEKMMSVGNTIRIAPLAAEPASAVPIHEEHPANLFGGLIRTLAVGHARADVAGAQAETKKAAGSVAPSKDEKDVSDAAEQLLTLSAPHLWGPPAPVPSGTITVTSTPHEEAAESKSGAGDTAGISLAPLPEPIGTQVGLGFGAATGAEPDPEPAMLGVSQPAPQPHAKTLGSSIERLVAKADTASPQIASGQAMAMPKSFSENQLAAASPDMAPQEVAAGAQHEPTGAKSGRDAAADILAPALGDRKGFAPAPQGSPIPLQAHGPAQLPDPATVPLKMPSAGPADSALEPQLDFQDGEWLDQLAREIAHFANSDGKTLRFRLNPENLGTVRIELSQDSHGAAIRLITETEAARSVLADAQPRLVQEARAQGLRISEAHVDLGGQAASEDPRRQREAPEPPPLKTARFLHGESRDDGNPTPSRSERYA